MGGFGRMLVRGLGAAMQGYGTTLIDQDAAATKQRDQQALLMREEALAAYKEQLARGTVQTTAATQVAVHRANAQTDSSIAINELPVRTAAKIQESTAEKKAAFDIWKQQQPIELLNKMTLAEQQAKFDKDRLLITQSHEDARNAADRQARLDTTPVLEGENTKGEPVAVFAPGATTRVVTARGGQKTGTDAAGDDDTSLAALTGKGKPVARSSAAPAAAAPAAPAYTFDQLYTAALSSPQMAGKSGAEIRAQAIRVAKANGIPAPDS